MVIAPDALVQHCRRAVRVASAVKVGTHDRGDVANLVEWLNEKDHFGDHDTWVNLGFALRLEFGDDGLDIWRLSHDDTVTESVEAAKWKSFDKEPTPKSVTLNSVMKDAHALGWRGTVRPSAASMFGDAVLQSNDIIAVSLDGEVPPELAERLANAQLPPGTPGPSNPGAEEQAADESAYPTPLKGFLRFPATFGDDFVPPDYLIDGILQKRFCYALTAQTGVGKTTVAMRLAAHVATGAKIGNIDVERGTVLYFAGENPTDVEMRWFGLTQEMQLDPKTTDVIFVYGALHLSKTVTRITNELVANNVKLSFVIVDTAAAFFETDDESSPMQNRDHAMRIRGLCSLPGGPCVLVLCHPTKVAKDISEMIPRGGSGFVNEIDGNIGLARIEGGPLIAQQVHKFRGREFEPLSFTLKTIGDHPRLIDSKGKAIPTVIAEPISSAEVARREERASNDEDKVLKHLCDNPGMKNSDVGKAMGGWHHEKTRRTLKSLADQGLAASTKDIWITTPKGQKYLNTVTTARPVQALPVLTPAVLGPAAFPTPQRPGTPPPMPPAPR